VDFEHVLVVGAGQMGGGIAQVVAASGRRVSLHDSFPGATERGLAAMRKSLERLAEKGGADPDEVLGRVTAVDGLATRPDILQKTTVDLMTARPSLPDWASSDWYYALGWQVRPQGTSANWWHTGSLPGTVTILVRAWSGLAWAALFNTRPADADAFATELDTALWTAVNGVMDWPSVDLFGTYPLASRKP